MKKIISTLMAAVLAAGIPAAVPFAASADEVTVQAFGDVNSDGVINLKDALIIQRYKAGIKVLGNIGDWIFESE